MSERAVARADGDNPAGLTGQRSALAHALRTISYEVLPFKGTENNVLAHVPPTVALTITATEAKGIDTTVALADRLTRHGYRAAPHLAARLIRDRTHLADIVDRLRAAGTDSVFVIGGDAPVPAGPFPDALSLLVALDEIGRPFRKIGIGGYPEGHGSIDDTRITQALLDKAPYASQVITQMCFHAGTVAAWARSVRDAGVTLPISVGLPGAVNRERLIRISAGLGLGQSARFLRKQSGTLLRFFLPGGYRPDRLVQRLTPAIAAPDSTISGLHLFTFNELAKTEAWRQRWLARIG